jgi:hypothetical protein
MRTLEAKNVEVRIGGWPSDSSATPTMYAGWRVFCIAGSITSETRALARGFMTIIFRVEPVNKVTNPIKLFTGQRAN